MRNPFRRKNTSYEMQNAYKKPKHPAIQLLLAILTAIIVYAVYTGLQVMIAIDKSRISLYAIISTVLIVVFFILVYRWLNKRQRNLPGVKPKPVLNGLKVAIFSVLGIYFAQIALGIVQLIVLGDEVASSANQEALEKMLKNPSLFLFMVLSIVVTAPLMEELIFRRILIGKVPPVKTAMFYFRVVLAVVAFAGAHVLTELTGDIGIKEVFAIATYLVLSAFITFVYVRTGSIWYSIAAHFINNSISVLMMITVM